MKEFKFETSCSAGKGWYCDARLIFFGVSAEDAERKAREWVASRRVRDAVFGEIAANINVMRLADEEEA